MHSLIFFLFCVLQVLMSESCSPHITVVEVIHIAVQGSRLTIFTIPFDESTPVCCLSLFWLIPK